MKTNKKSGLKADGYNLLKTILYLKASIALDQS